MEKGRMRYQHQRYHVSLTSRRQQQWQLLTLAIPMHLAPKNSSTCVTLIRLAHENCNKYRVSCVAIKNAYKTRYSTCYVSSNVCKHIVPWAEARLTGFSHILKSRWDFWQRLSPEIGIPSKPIKQDDFTNDYCCYLFIRKKNVSDSIATISTQLTCHETQAKPVWGGSRQFAQAVRLKANTALSLAALQAAVNVAN